MCVDCHYHAQQKVAIPKRARKNTTMDGRLELRLIMHPAPLDGDDFAEHLLAADGRIRLRQQVTLNDQEIS